MDANDFEARTFRCAVKSLFLVKVGFSRRQSYHGAENRRSLRSAFADPQSQRIEKHRERSGGDDNQKKGMRHG